MNEVVVLYGGRPWEVKPDRQDANQPGLRNTTPSGGMVNDIE